MLDFIYLSPPLFPGCNPSPLKQRFARLLPFFGETPCFDTNENDVITELFQQNNSIIFSFADMTFFHIALIIYRKLYARTAERLLLGKINPYLLLITMKGLL